MWVWVLMVRLLTLVFLLWIVYVFRGGMNVFGWGDCGLVFGLVLLWSGVRDSFGFEWCFVGGDVGCAWVFRLGVCSLRGFTC